MLFLSIPLTPLLGVLFITLTKDISLTLKVKKLIALGVSILTFILSLIAFILFDFSTNNFQFVLEYHKISYFDFYLGVDGLSMYFVLLTTIIIPGSLLSNWKSIKHNVELYLIILLLLETLLLMVFIVLDVFLFYILFESILPPLFILVGMFGSENRIKAGFYLFLYTLLGSLFLLLSILSMSSTMCTTDYDSLFKKNFKYAIQLFLFYGIFIAFAVKTPTIFLNTWLLKAHVESPLGGSIILAAIVLKLSLYGIFRLILAVLVKAFMACTFIIFLIGVITIIYASLSTLRTIDVKELIAYSSVSHAAVYLLGAFGNCVQGIVGSICLGLAHGLVSPGLFICAGGILYDRAHTRLISLYKGMTQLMPLFAIVFFIFCLANCGVPLTLNFVGEFMSLFGVFVRSLVYGVIASLSIVFSAAYSMVLFQKIAFGGSYSQMLKTNLEDVVSREFSLVIPLVILTVLFGIYPAVIIDAVSYAASGLIFNASGFILDSSRAWEIYFQDYSTPKMGALVELHNIIYYLVAIFFILATLIRGVVEYYGDPMRDIPNTICKVIMWFIYFTLPCIFLFTNISLEIWTHFEFIKTLCQVGFSEEYYFTGALFGEPYADLIFCSSSNTVSGAPDSGGGPSGPSPGNSPSSPGEGPSDPNRNNNSSDSTGGTSDSKGNKTYTFVSEDPARGYAPSNDVPILPEDKAYIKEEKYRHQHEHLTNPNLHIKDTANNLEEGKPIEEKRLDTFNYWTKGKITGPNHGEQTDSYIAEVKAKWDHWKEELRRVQEDEE